MAEGEALPVREAPQVYRIGVPDRRNIITAGENACPEGEYRNHLGDCVPEFLDENDI